MHAKVLFPMIYRHLPAFQVLFHQLAKERSGVSLAALKTALAAAGYDVEKNNSRIKLGLKSLVSKGTLVQT